MVIYTEVTASKTMYSTVQMFDVTKIFYFKITF